MGNVDLKRFSDDTIRNFHKDKKTLKEPIFRCCIKVKMLITSSKTVRYLVVLTHFPFSKVVVFWVGAPDTTALHHGF